MSGSDPQKQLLTIIRDFATEKSQGERRIVNFKKRTQELLSELDAVNADLEDSKRLKEVTEQELKGYDVELAMADASIQTLEIITASVFGDDFIDKMLKLNSKIRNFQDTVKYTFNEANSKGTTSKDEAGFKATDAEDAEVSRRALDTELPQTMSQTTAVEQEYPADQNANKQVQRELLDVERKVSLMEAIRKESKELQELTRYPFQNSWVSLLYQILTEGPEDYK
ncbi:hypothetical protein RJ640_029855, partial [Escallonia rubra]